MLRVTVGSGLRLEILLAKLLDEVCFSLGVASERDVIVLGIVVPVTFNRAQPRHRGILLRASSLSETQTPERIRVVVPLRSIGNGSHIAAGVILKSADAAQVRNRSPHNNERCLIRGARTCSSRIQLACL